jgi:hypothetical protein
VLDVFGRVYIAGSETSGGVADWKILKYDANGAPSPTWPDNGVGVGARRFGKVAGQSDFIQSILVDTSGNVYGYGDSRTATTVGKAQIVKYNSAGVLQWNYEYAGGAVNDHANGGALTSDGKVIISTSGGRAVIVDGVTGAASSNWPDIGLGVGVRQLAAAASGANLAVDRYDTAYFAGSTTQSGLSTGLVHIITADGAQPFTDLISHGFTQLIRVAFDETGGVVFSGTGSSAVATARYHRYRLSGSVDLQDFEGRVEGMQIVLELRDSDNRVIETYTPELTEGGRFYVDSDYVGDCTFTAKGSHWLRQVASETNMPLWGNSLSFRLTNGDCDDDNEVSIGDYSLLSHSFGLSAGDPNFLAEGDLNGDDTVDIGDFSILSANYGLVGDD